MANGFRDLVREVSQELTQEESQDLAYLNHLPERFYHERTILLMLELEARCIISDKNPEMLADQLDRLKRADLANRVRKWSPNKKSNKKRPPVDNSRRVFSCHVVAVALAKLQVANASHQIDLIHECMQCEDSDLVKAKALCKMINNLLSKVEKKGVLQNPIEISSKLPDTDDEISPPSSLTEDGIYEPLCYPETETGNISPKTISSPSSPSFSSSPTGNNSSRPPQPAPKPSKRQLPTQHIPTDQQPKLSLNFVATPLVGLSTTLSTLRKKNQDLSDSGGEEGEEEGTGDSTLYTGSCSDSGFSDAQKFLKTGLKQIKQTLVKPKEERYTSLQRNKSPSSEYMKLQTVTQDDSEYSYATNHREDGDDIYSIPQHERQQKRLDEYSTASKVQL